MSDKRHVVKVTIVGEEYTIRSDASPEHTKAVAQYVDQAIRRVLTSTPVADSRKAAILAALQLTDELFRSRDAHDRVEDAMDALSAEVRRWLPPHKRGDSGENAAI